MPANISSLNSILEVIGTLNDYPVLGESSLFGYAKGGYQHIHEPAKCYPSLADSTTFTAGAAKWEESSAQVLVPANTISLAFDIHFLQVEAVSANAIYEISLWSGENADLEIGRVRVLRQSTPSGTQGIPIQIPPQPANTKISVKVATNSTNADTISFSIFYHNYTLPT